MRILIVRLRRKLNFSTERLLLAAGLALACSPIMLAQANSAQTGASTVATPQVPGEPKWQTVAGSKMEFAVASIRLDKSGVFKPPSIPIGPDNSLGKDGPVAAGLFTADFHVGDYISFAYKLNADQRKQMYASLPTWAATENFEIHARSELAHPTKDQLRLMMQSLLADRFNLAFHTETRERPVLALVLITPGKTGPNFRPHADGPPCAVATSSSDSPQNSSKPKSPTVWPPSCDIYMAHMTPNHLFEVGARNTTMDLLASSLSGFGSFDRPMVDQTGLEGEFDFTLRWTPEPGSPFLPPDATILSDVEETTFSDALKNQLGIKLESSKSPMEVLVVDHIERPSEN